MSITKLPQAQKQSRNLSTITLEEAQAEMNALKIEGERLVAIIEDSENQIKSLDHKISWWKGIFDLRMDEKLLEEHRKKLQAEALTPEEIKQGFVIQDHGKENEPCQSKP